MSMNHEHSRPFSLAEHEAGAPVGCRSRLLTPRIHDAVGDYLYGIILRGVGGARPTSHEWSKSDGHEHPGGILGPHDLVMLPLFLLDGKPVFVGDELVNDQGFPVKAGPLHDNSDGKWRWPAPKVETRMTDPELLAMRSDFEGRQPITVQHAYREIANAAIARAIADGDVILPGLQVSPRKLRDGDCFMDISEPGAPVGNIYGSREAIDLVRERFSMVRKAIHATAYRFGASMSESAVDDLFAHIKDTK